MHVGIDVRAMQFAGGLQGTGRFIRNLLNGLSLLGNDTRYSLLYFAERPLPEELQHLGEPFSLAPIPGPSTLESRHPWYQATPKLRQMRVLPGIHWRAFLKRSDISFSRMVRGLGVDVVHFPACFYDQSPPIPSCPAKTVYTFLDGIPLVLSDRYYNTWPIPRQRLYNRQKAALQASDRVVAISEASRIDAIRLFGLAEDRVQTVYCGVPQPDGTTDCEVRTRFGITRPYFAFCSMISWHKGADRLIEAMSNLRLKKGLDCQLVVIGQQSEAAARDFRATAFDCKLHSGDVVLTGYVDQGDLNALVKGAVALVSPSRYEGFGLPAAEAMGLGTPVIASNRASLPEVVGNAELLVDPENAAAIADAMERLAHDGRLRESCISKGFEQFKKFDIVDRARDMWNVYRAV